MVKYRWNHKKTKKENEMAYVKNYNPGQIKLDLPSANHIYELPLFSFSDVYGGVGLSVVYNRAFVAMGDQHFGFYLGYKLNLQKKILFNGNGSGDYIDADGKTIHFWNDGGVYLFKDEGARVMVSAGNSYKVFYPDNSYEIFDQSGKITLMSDKYGHSLASFTYGSNGLLTSITIKNKHVISISNNAANMISSISHNGLSIGFVHPAGPLNVSHYSGVSYSIVPTSGYGLTATATGTENSVSVSHSVRLTLSGTNVRSSYLINNNEVDHHIYSFPDEVNCQTLYNQVEITDKYGVKTRTQYQGKHPTYSYEVTGNDDVAFVNVSNKYGGAVTLHRQYLTTEDGQPKGIQRLNDGAAMNPTDSREWEHDITRYSSVMANGYFVLSGWVKAQANCDDPENVVIQLYTSAGPTYFSIDATPRGTWKYFTHTFKISTAVVRIHLDSFYVCSKDLRVTFQETGKIKDDDSSHLTFTSEVLYCRRADTASYDKVPLSEATFSHGAFSRSNKDDLYDRIHYNDILRYKKNQAAGVNTNHFYYNNGESIYVLPSASDSYITVEYNGVSYNLHDAFLGNEVFRHGHGNVITQINNMTVAVGSQTQGYLVIQTKKATGELISSQTLDNKLDVISVTNEGVTTAYERMGGLITSESVSDSSGQILFTRTMSYGTDSGGNDVVTLVDEFGKSTVITLDSNRGVELSLTAPDNSITSNEYDSDYSALTKRTFSGSAPRSNQLAYFAGNLQGVNTGSLGYEFEYTDGKLSKVEKSDAPVEQHVNTDTSTTSHYPSSEAALYSEITNLDKYGRPISIENQAAFTYSVFPLYDEDTGEMTSTIYNASSVPATVIDHVANETTRYSYNTSDKVISALVAATDDYSDKKRGSAYDYDAIGRLSKHIYDRNTNDMVVEQIGYRKAETDPAADNVVQSYSYYHLEHSSVNPVASSQNTFDSFNRVSERSINVGNVVFTNQFVYDKTWLNMDVLRINDSLQDLFDYNRDDMGRLESILINNTDGAYFNSYVYDSFGQLVRENNHQLGKSFTYSYDSLGNITSVDEYAYTTSSTLGTRTSQKSFVYQADRLTNANGQGIGYDTLGRPTTVGPLSYQWSRNKLSGVTRGSLSQYGTLYHNTTFDYNGMGQRTGKHYQYDSTVGSTNDYSYTYDTEYNYDGAGRLMREVCTEHYMHGTTTVYELIYLYNESGMIGVRLSVNGGAFTDYYYRRNALGDVLAIYDTSYTRVVEYAYDAWGNCTTLVGAMTAIGKINPIRYRGYYYDRETGLYFLNARYYDPSWRRFVSPDDTAYLDPESVNGLNLYAYCNNDPVNKYDPSGYFAISAVIIGALVGAAIGFGGTVLADYVDDGQIFNGSISVGSYIANTLIGGLIGGLTGGIASSSFTFSYPTLQFAQMATTEGLIIGSVSVGTATATIGGVSIVTVLGLAGVTVLATRIGKSGGYRIDHHYPNDHAPTHVHISGDDGTTRVDINGNPIQGDRPMTPGEKKAFWRLIDKIIDALKPWM